MTPVAGAQELTGVPTPFATSNREHLLQRLTSGTTTAIYGGNFSGILGCVMFSGAGSFPNGTPLADLGWYDCNNTPSGTKAVKGKAPNAWGLYDMLGNI